MQVPFVPNDIMLRLVSSRCGLVSMEGDIKLLSRLRVLKNIGIFPYVDAGKDLELRKLTLIYAENGRGKTTIASVLRSLADNDPSTIIERKRLDSQEDPKVVLELTDGSFLLFKDGKWNNQSAPIAIFDDTFVEENVYSGLTVSPQQRQRMHSVILGHKAIALEKQLEKQITKVEKYNQQLRLREAAVPEAIRGQMSLKEFLALTPDPNIDERIRDVESELAAIEERDTIQKTRAFQLLELPRFTTSDIDHVLGLGLDSLERDAIERVQQHLSAMDHDSEAWVAEGMLRLVSPDGGIDTASCPFCGQSLDGIALVQHYQAYFSEGYRDLKDTIRGTTNSIESTYGETLKANFEREMRVAVELRQFWMKFCNIGEFAVDTATIFDTLKLASDSILSILSKKGSRPLDKLVLTNDIRDAIKNYEDQLKPLTEINRQLREANTAIENLKDRVESSTREDLLTSLGSLRARKIRFAPEMQRACDDYLGVLEAKEQAETKRNETREFINQHRELVFPKYESVINNYLTQFGVDFTLRNMKGNNLRVGSSVTYEAQIGRDRIRIGSSTASLGEPSFGTVLSSGDRNTLAFAFFLAMLGELPRLDETIVVIDDPISSMDANRASVTVEKIRTLSNTVAQTIVLSHDREFLHRIWRKTLHSDSSALEIGRMGSNSTFLEWDVGEELLSDHDRRYRRFAEYLDVGSLRKYEIARDIRPHLESFIRTTCPQAFPPESSLGKPFLEVCKNSLGSKAEIISKSRIEELENLLEYAHKFHHDTNPNAASEVVNDGELRSYVGRTLEFTRLSMA